MILTLEQLTAVTRGAVRIYENEAGFVHFERFPEGQANVYKESFPGFYLRAQATSGVCLDFYTGSRTFGFDWCLLPGSSQPYGRADVLVDGVLVAQACKDGFTEGETGRFDMELPEGSKRVTVWLPCLATCTLKNVTLDDGSDLLEVSTQGILLSFGDSITQGYVTTHPSFAYPTQVANALNLTLYNRGIGGEVFRPELIADGDTFRPDLITVAYGTNDWGTDISFEKFVTNAANFFAALEEKYPGVCILALTPIWRSKIDRVTKIGSYADLVRGLEEAAMPHPQVVLVKGIGLTPHLPEFYTDGLHPNDLGFQLYAKNLLQAIQRLD